MSFFLKNIYDSVTGKTQAGKAVDVLSTAAGQQKDLYQKGYAPYVQAGQTALGRISDIMSGKTTVNLGDMPGYTAGLEAGTENIQRAASARGALGGSTLASLFGFGQRYAGQAFNQYMGQLSSIAGMGEQATGAQLSGMSDAIGAQAQARASGYMGSAARPMQALGLGAGLLGQFGGGLSSAVSGLSGMFGGGGASPASLFSASNPAEMGRLSSMMGYGSSQPVLA